MHRCADAIVLFEHGHRPTIGGQASSSRQATRSATNDCDIEHAAPIISGWIHFESLHLGSAMFPTAHRRDPERLQDQLQVEPERCLLDVREVVTELLVAWQVARGVHLRDTGEAWTHTMPCLVSGNR